ncbi:MAG: VTT domain-containing protein [Streptomycetales bacterium]
MTILTTLAIGFASAVFPLVNLEIYLVSLTLVAGPEHIVALGVAAAIGQTAGKALSYAAGRGAVEVSRLRAVQHSGGQTKWRKRATEWTDRLNKRPGGTFCVLALSAFLGLPPLLGISVLAGSLRMPFTPFLTICFLGRLGRCILLLLSPQSVEFFW